jgi:hypothetical protein
MEVADFLWGGAAAPAAGAGQPRVCCLGDAGERGAVLTCRRGAQGGGRGP